MNPDVVATSYPCARIGELRARIRAACDRCGVALETRARLVLAATVLARPVLAAGGPVTVTAWVAPEEAGLLHIDLTALDGEFPEAAFDALPLPAERTAPGTAAWRVPHDPGLARPEVTRDEEATELELGAVLARSDEIDREHRELKHEIAETNSGVLAMYVQLEERDHQLRRAHAMIFRELEDALRTPPPAIAGMDLAVHYAPAGSQAPTGGDLYDWFVLPDGTLHITIVDAVGHGVTCTRSALYVIHTVRTLALEGHQLSALIGRTARVLGVVDPDLMATVQLIRHCPSTSTLHLVNGGHPPPLLVRADGETAYLPALGRGVGFPEPGSTEVVTAHLPPGDLLLLYTDGLTESRRKPDEDEVRLAGLAARHRHRPTRDIPAKLVDEMHNEVVHLDDTLVIALRPTRD
jgi:serine phosphatase RsbU (regulator of sigma subunit)